MANPLHNTHLRDPFQGFDVSIKVVQTPSSEGGLADTVLPGGFTGFMCRIECKTEAYLEIGQRVPRMLDGELVNTWMLEQGLKTMRPVADTFGSSFADAFAKGRTPQSASGTHYNIIPRTRRFDIQMAVNTKEAGQAITEISESTFFQTDNSGKELKTDDLNLKIILRHSRIDNGTFGVVAGRRVASSSWQGTSQHVIVEKKQG